MHAKSISAHLKPYRMIAARRTTINHMFAAAVAPHDVYEEARVREALLQLGNNPESELECAYCGRAAETWDHVFATVKDSKFSGFGHRLGNLLPCCKPCNSRKGNKLWHIYLSDLPMSDAERQLRVSRISSHIERYCPMEPQVDDTATHRRLDEIRLQILQLMADADQLAEQLRQGLRG
ncbi:MAG: hypothetical protein KGQ52_00035 [Alphaproteobacteria bacterium]|nr:hypothetical protein [Alphaproteobacteria bacterium]